MADVQKQFKQFHDNIKLGTYDEEQKLRDKRDLLIKELKDGLKEEKVPGTEKVLTFSKFDQGSYAMGTGIQPIDGKDYDIDVGLKFDITQGEYNPVALKRKIRDVLQKRPNRNIEIRQPCVTVKYADGYHVDLAVYEYRYTWSTTQLNLAKGRESSKAENVFWQIADPEGLKTWVSNRGSDADQRAQFRRLVRYLKKWRNRKFTGDFKPISIGLTVLAGQEFTAYTNDDLAALLNIVQRIKRRFVSILFEDGYSLTCNLPVEPSNNLFEFMTAKQGKLFKEKVDVLVDALEKAKNEALPEDACQILMGIFGDEFPIPEKKETAKRTQSGFAGTGSSA